MKSKELIEKSLRVREKGVIHLFVFLALQVAMKLGGILFLFLVIGDFLFDYKAMQFFGVGERIRQSAIIGIIFGLVPMIIIWICIEILYRRRK